MVRPFASVSMIAMVAVSILSTPAQAEQAIEQPGIADATGTEEITGEIIVTARRDAENNVALVVDGVLKPSTSQLNQLQGELVQAEILKGPQGA